MPRRIQLRRTKGWRIPPNTLKVDRTTRWGNPFAADKPADLPRAHRWGFTVKNEKHRPVDQAEAVALFRSALDDQSRSLIRLHLFGKNLACWCKPGEPCHADVLLEVANSKRQG